MLTIHVSDKSIGQSTAQGHVFLFSQDRFSVPTAATKLFPKLEKYLKQSSFTGASGDLFVTPVSDNNLIMYLICLGIGKQGKTETIESYRRALGNVVRATEKYKINSIALELPPVTFFINADSFYIAEQTALALRMASYFFDPYISDEARKLTPLEVTVFVSRAEKEVAQSGVDRGMLIGHAVNQTRYWIDLPPSTLTPPELADKAKEIAVQEGLKVTVFNEEKINELGMGGLAGVSRGSYQDCRLVILEYKVPDKNAPTLVFVGKGITFDSGGLSLKPADYMENMKDDMSGAAAVINVMQAIAQLKPKVNVIGITPLAENLPSGTALKPGDIVRFYNGKTAEVKNTDAEGRLILADALSYAVKHYQPTAIIDAATLTGACMHALGPFFSGLFSQDEQLVERLQKSAQHTGDYVWRLPLTSDYDKAIKSDVADISNIGSKQYNAGATTAACFLKQFVGQTPWAHLDIAGTAFNVPDISYYRPGATGAGVRLLIDLALNWK